MASPPITEASEIRRRGRQRLIGAIALVAILVVFVPMLLDSDPRPSRPEPALAIPPKASAPPLPAPPKAEARAPAAAPSEPPKASTVEATPAKAATVEPAPAAPAKSAEKAPKAAAEKAPKAAATPKLEGFAVQVGAFRDESKLAQARQKLTAEGIAHYTERLEVKSGPLTRLRAGPFPTREAAESALATLKRSAVEGKVVTLP